MFFSCRYAAHSQLSVLRSDLEHQKSLNNKLLASLRAKDPVVGSVPIAEEDATEAAEKESPEEKNHSSSIFFLLPFFAVVSFFFYSAYRAVREARTKVCLVEIFLFLPILLRFVMSLLSPLCVSFR
jgi:hypothetical protein